MNKTSLGTRFVDEAKNSEGDRAEVDTAAIATAPEGLVALMATITVVEPQVKRITSEMILLRDFNQ